MTTPVIDPTRLFYVTVQDAGKVGFLLGPYETHAEALANVDKGKEQAEKVDPWAHFYAFGTSSLPRETVKQTVFGK